MFIHSVRGLRRQSMTVSIRPGLLENIRQMTNAAVLAGDHACYCEH
jgi:hypothetical protein